MKRRCRVSGVEFELSPWEGHFLDRIAPMFSGRSFQIPPPTLCPEERQRRRMAFRNERRYYVRTCDRTGKRIVSIYSPDNAYTVYSLEEWWSDSWDGLQFGREFDFSRTLSEQLSELLHLVPRQAIFQTYCENCDYNNYIRNSRNCYLSSLIADGCEDVYHSYWITKSRNIFDCLFVVESELLYDCIDTYNSYDCAWLQFAQNCRNCLFGYGLTGCRDCFGCVNLNNKHYYWFNEPLTKDEYVARLKNLNLSTHESFEKVAGKYRSLELSFPHRATTNRHVENCIGDNIRDARNCFYCYDGYDAEDSRYIHSFFMIKDCMDGYAIGSYDTELCYECCVVYGNSHVLFSTNINRGTNIFYSDSLEVCSDCFACVGLKHQQYCILNRQYSKVDYEQLAARIVEHLIQTGEWGEFFSPKLSCFGYNETVASDYFPLRGEAALERGYKWSDFEPPIPEVERTIRHSDLPPSVHDVSEDIRESAILCKESGKPFRIAKQELSFLQERGYPLPLRHPEVRHTNRLVRRNPRRLWKRVCAKTGKEILTTYAPDRSEIVYSEDAYREALD